MPMRRRMRYRLAGELRAGGSARRRLSRRGQDRQAVQVRRLRAAFRSSPWSATTKRRAGQWRSRTWRRGEQRRGRRATRRRRTSSRVHEDFTWLNNSVTWPAPTPAAPCAPPTSAPMSSCSAGCSGFATSARSSSSTCAIAHGHTQVIVEGDDALLERAKRLRSEYVVAVAGPGRAPLAETDERQACRPARSKCARSDVRVLNEAKTPPFPIAEERTSPKRSG